MFANYLSLKSEQQAYCCIVHKRCSYCIPIKAPMRFELHHLFFSDTIQHVDTATWITRKMSQCSGQDFIYSLWENQESIKMCYNVVYQTLQILIAKIRQTLTATDILTVQLWCHKMITQIFVLNTKKKSWPVKPRIFPRNEMQCLITLHQNHRTNAAWVFANVRVKPFLVQSFINKHHTWSK